MLLESLPTIRSTAYHELFDRISGVASPFSGSAVPPIRCSPSIAPARPLVERRIQRTEVIYNVLLPDPTPTAPLALDLLPKPAVSPLSGSRRRWWRSAFRLLVALLPTCTVTSVCSPAKRPPNWSFAIRIFRLALGIRRPVGFFLHAMPWTSSSDATDAGEYTTRP